MKEREIQLRYRIGPELSQYIPFGEKTKIIEEIVRGGAYLYTAYIEGRRIRTVSMKKLSDNALENKFRKYVPEKERKPTKEEIISSITKALVNAGINS